MQVIAEALARFRLEVEPVEKFQLVQVALESGRGEHSAVAVFVLLGRGGQHWQSKMMMMISLIIIGNQR